MIKKAYFDFFRRGNEVLSWRNSIGIPRRQDDESGKFGQLHHDVFNHHHRPNSSSTFSTKLIVQKEDVSRIISLDNLTDYYINSDLLVESPLIESQYPDEEEESQEKNMTGFEKFYKCVTDIPFHKDDLSDDRLGENRVAYLFGSVGSGKSFLCARIIARLLQKPLDNHGFRVIPIRVCFESLERSKTINPSEISDSFFIYILGQIDRRTKPFRPTVLEPPVISTTATEQMLFSYIEDFVLRLAKAGIRLLIIFDNIDVFHYRFSRYFFFKEHHDKFLESINYTIVKICNTFTDDALLGNLGLCILVVARENVAKDFMGNLADPAKSVSEGHRKFWLKEIDPKDIIESRYRLLDLATKAIIEAGGSISGDGAPAYLDALRVAKELILKSASNSSEGLGIIWGLCHHGHRSLVDFISKIKVNYYSQREIHNRLFGDNPHNLERLYISNMTRKYAQSRNHFPNLFLCDMWINPENIQMNVSIPHYHSYWLKYLMLRFVLSRESKGGVSAGALLREFVKGMGYEDNFARLCLGSLCQVNESRCLEIEGSPEGMPERRLLKLTSRGRVMIDKDYIKARSVPYCFDLNYLQLVIDDFWLALPTKFYEEIFKDVTLSYTFFVGERYREGVSKYLAEKIFSTLTFVRVLESSWAYEAKMHNGESSIYKEFCPDFNLIYDNLFDTICAIITGGFGGTISAGGRIIGVKTVSEFIEALRHDDAYHAFFHELALSGCAVESNGDEFL